MLIQNKIRVFSKGFSAIEAIFAILILSFGLMGYLTLFAHLTESTVNDELTLAGTRLASEKIEQLVADKAANGYGSLTIGESTETVPYSSHDFSRQTSIQYVNESDLTTVMVSDTGFKRIDITVSWNIGQTHNVQLTSILSDY